ncbi:MAG: Rpn family recombination-promoting nuclease/putative transposase [Chthoniobacterales bacterium]
MKSFENTLTDVLYEASFRGKAGYIYILIEHQRKSDPLMALRMLEYSCNIFRMHLKKTNSEKLPLVYPVVFYNGEKTYAQTTDFFELFDDPDSARSLFLKPFQLIDLNQYEDDSFKKESLLGIVEMFLKHAFTRDIFSLVQEKMAGMIENLVAKNKIELFTLAVSYLLSTQEGRLSRSDLISLFQPYLSSSTRTKFMTIADSLIEQGLEQGLEQSRKKLRMLLDKQLRKRFPTTVTSQHLFLLETADSDMLSSWIERLMEASSIEEVF